MSLLGRGLFVLVLAPGALADAADMRERMRQVQPAGTGVSRTQAEDLTLTVTQIEVRPIQNWVRLAGTLDRSGRILTSNVTSAEAISLALGQRARAFSPGTRSSMYQAKITRLEKQGERVLVEATLSGAGDDLDADYLLEVVVDLGELLSVPNEAIIEEGGRQIVYVQGKDGRYLSREITTQLQGERYTQVLRGVSAGEQVVTTGSFFIDAEYKMKGAD
jgi:hypothetical protein